MIRQIKQQSTKILGFFLVFKGFENCKFSEIAFHAKMNDAWNKLAAKHKIIRFLFSFQVVVFKLYAFTPTATLGVESYNFLDILTFKLEKIFLKLPFKKMDDT